MDLDQFFTWIRQGMGDLGYTLEALGAAMHPPRDKSYVDKVLRQEKPCSLAFLRGLPDDLEAFVASKHAESFGRIVVPPAPDHETAARHLVSGLFGLLAPRTVPDVGKKRMARAYLPAEEEEP